MNLLQADELHCTIHVVPFQYGFNARDNLNTYHPSLFDHLFLFWNKKQIPPIWNQGNCLWFYMKVHIKECQSTLIKQISFVWIFINMSDKLQNCGGLFPHLPSLWINIRSLDYWKQLSHDMSHDIIPLHSTC